MSDGIDIAGGEEPRPKKGLRRVFQRTGFGLRNHRNALSARRDDAAVWVQLGDALKERGKLAEADEAYRKALTLHPEADTYLRLGRLRTLQARTDEAAAAYVTALAYDPSLLAATRELAALGWAENHLTELKTIVAEPNVIEADTAPATESSPAPSTHDALRGRLLDSGLFDPDFYNAHNADVAENGIDPLDHFILYGAREGRDPCAAFDMKAYLAAYPGAADGNPLLHYLEIGRHEGFALRALHRPSPTVLTAPLDIAELRNGSAERSVLMVLHNLGGGTAKHVFELCDRLRTAGIPSYLLQPIAAHPSSAELLTADIREPKRIGYIDVKHGLSEAVILLQALGIFHVHIHHLLGFPQDSLYFFPQLCRELRITYDFSFHDYLAICPRIYMVDGGGVFCEKGHLAACETCVAQHRSPFGDVSVVAWRGAYGHLLHGARKLFAPDEDVAMRVCRAMPGLDITVRPHPERIRLPRQRPVARRPDEPLRVAVLGCVGQHKGIEQLQRCIEDAAARRLPITYVVFGSDSSGFAGSPNVEITGSFRAPELPLLLARRPCHIAFIPSVCPETYSYVLTELLFAGLFPVVFDLGAQARRVRAYGWGLVLPLALARQPARINDALLSCEIPPMPDHIPVAGADLYDDIIADYYELDTPLHMRNAGQSDDLGKPGSIRYNSGAK